MKSTLSARAATRWLSRPCSVAETPAERDCPARCPSPTSLETTNHGPRGAASTSSSSAKAHRDRGRQACGWTATASGSRPAPAARQARREAQPARSSGASTVVPAFAAPRAVERDALRHLVVEGLRGGDVGPRRRQRRRPASRHARSCRSAHRREGRSGFALQDQAKLLRRPSAEPAKRWPHQRRRCRRAPPRRSGW